MSSSLPNDLFACGSPEFHSCPNKMWLGKSVFIHVAPKGDSAFIYVMHGHLKIVIKGHSSVEISTFQVSGYEVSKTEINLVGIHNNKDACPDVIFLS